MNPETLEKIDVCSKASTKPGCSTAQSMVRSSGLTTWTAVPPLPARPGFRLLVTSLAAAGRQGGKQHEPAERASRKAARVRRSERVSARSGQIPHQ